MIRLFILLSVMMVTGTAWGETTTNDLVNRVPPGVCWSIDKGEEWRITWPERSDGTCDLRDAFDGNMKAEWIKPPHTWHLLTKSYGGTVSLIKDLTESECATMKLKLNPLPVYTTNQVSGVGPDTIVQSECFE
jgi:hypothetical protein